MQKSAILAHIYVCGRIQPIEIKERHGCGIELAAGVGKTV